MGTVWGWRISLLQGVLDMVSLPLRGLVPSEFSYILWHVFLYYGSHIASNITSSICFTTGGGWHGSFLDCIGSQCRKNSERTRARISTSHASFTRSVVTMNNYSLFYGHTSCRDAMWFKSPAGRRSRLELKVGQVLQIWGMRRDDVYISKCRRPRLNGLLHRVSR
jgi:hypothetical protein